MEPRRFVNRHDAGRKLAARMGAYAGRADVVVLALPRGGVPVGFEVAAALGVPLDVLIVRKLGVPGHEELAMGAIAGGGLRVLNEHVIQSLGIEPAAIERAAARESREIEHRRTAYRGDRPEPAIAGKTLILVDDGLATGSTMRAAVAALKTRQPGRIIVAVPVAPEETCEALREEVDELVCLIEPRDFRAVGLWYHDFDQTSDEEVRELLGRTPSAGAGS